MHVAVFATQFDTVVSGPGTFIHYLRDYSFARVEFTFITDNTDKSAANVILADNTSPFQLLPFSWVSRSHNFAQSIPQSSQVYDCILCTSALEAGFVINRNAKVPVLIMINDAAYLNGTRDFKLNLNRYSKKKAFADLIYGNVERYISKRAAAIISNSTYTSQLIKQRLGATCPPVYRLYKSVDSQAFPLRKSQTDTHAPRKLLFLKSNYMRGGLDLVLDALTQLPTGRAYTLTVAGIAPGEVDNVTQLTKHAERCGNTVQILGRLKRPALKELYHTHDLFVNMARQEALGVSCLEAMACGLPVIANRIGGLPEVLDHGRAGMLIEPTVQALVEKLNDLEENPAELKKYRTPMQTQTKKFSLDNMASTLEDIVYSVVDSQVVA